MRHRHLSPSRLTLGVLLIAAATLAACGSSAEPADQGRICVPESDDCPSSQELRRDYPGRNTVDVAIHNRGPEATVSLFIGPSDTRAPTLDASIDGSADTGDAPASATDSAGTVVRNYSMDPDQTIRERFVTTELFTRNTLTISLNCRPCPNCDSSCRASVDYVRLTRRLDCESSDDCPGDRRCDSRLGTCVECRSDSDCRVDQRCDRTNGRCVPPAQPQGCATADTGRSLGWTLAVLLLLALFARGVLPLANDARNINAVRITSLVAAAGLCLLPATSSAQSLRSTLSLEAGLRMPTGELATHVKRGIGIQLQQTLRGRHLGANASIGTDYFLTTQPPPPFERELQIVQFSVGPRAYIPIGDLEIGVGAAYRRLGLGPNALVRFTGRQASFHGFGVSTGASYQFRGFEASASVDWRPTLGLELGVVAINVGIGLTAR